MQNGGTFLSEDTSVKDISNLGESMETALFLLSALDDFVKRGPVIFESLNHEVIRLREKLGKDGKDIGELITLLLSALSSKEIAALIEILASSYQESKEHKYRTSITGIMRALTDEDIQRALAFIFLFLKKFGQHIAKE